MCLITTVVAKLLLKGFIEFNDNKYYIHAAGDWHRPPCDDDAPNMARADDTQPASADALVLRVSNIPRTFTEPMLLMILENRRYGGGDVKRLKFKQTDHSAVVEFEDRTGMCSNVLTPLVMLIVPLVVFYSSTENAGLESLSK